MKTKEDLEKFLEDNEMLEGNDMTHSEGDGYKLGAEFFRLQRGEITEMEYLIFRCNIPGTTRPKNPEEKTLNQTFSRK